MLFKLFWWNPIVWGCPELIGCNIVSFKGWSNELEYIVLTFESILLLKLILATLEVITGVDIEFPKIVPLVVILPVPSDILPVILDPLIVDPEIVKFVRPLPFPVIIPVVVILPVPRFNTLPTF